LRGGDNAERGRYREARAEGPDCAHAHADARATATPGMRFAPGIV
jgi:hypothetical protein